MNPFEDPEATYVVVVNSEEQFSLWPHATPIPGGWSPSFGPGSREACLEFIEKNWIDMRPLSVRVAMASEQG